MTAGIGSDHVDLQGAIDRGLTVTEVTYCNSISVSQHVVMQMLALVRNYIPATNLIERTRGQMPALSLPLECTCSRWAGMPEGKTEGCWSIALWSCFTGRGGDG